MVAVRRDPLPAGRTTASPGGDHGDRIRHASRSNRVSKATRPNPVEQVGAVRVHASRNPSAPVPPSPPGRYSPKNRLGRITRMDSLQEGFAPPSPGCAASRRVHGSHSGSALIGLAVWATVRVLRGLSPGCQKAPVEYAFLERHGASCAESLIWPVAISCRDGGEFLTPSGLSTLIRGPDRGGRGIRLRCPAPENGRRGGQPGRACPAPTRSAHHV